MESNKPCSTPQTNSAPHHVFGHGEEKPLGKRCTYRDCLTGRAPIPHQTGNDAIFQVMMCAGMVAFMTTINGLRNTGLGFLNDSLWLYPLIFCIALLVRILYTSKLMGILSPRLIRPHFKGAPQVLMTSIVNTTLTSPLMCAITTLLLVGPENFWVNYFLTLPITAPTSILVGYFIVGPAVKMIYNNHISPEAGMHILEELNEDRAAIARILGLS